jgi:hypothetical protein
VSVDTERYKRHANAAAPQTMTHAAGKNLFIKDSSQERAGEGIEANDIFRVQTPQY